MGACSSTEGTTSAINAALIDTLKASVKREINDSTDISSTVVSNIQNIRLRTVLRDDLNNNPFFLERTPPFPKGIFGLFGTVNGCPIYGCNYSITQSSNINIKNFNADIITFLAIPSEPPTSSTTTSISLCFKISTNSLLILFAMFGPS